MFNSKKLVALILLVTLFASISACALADTKVYSLDELQAMTGEELLALATTKSGSVQAKKSLEEGDQEIGLYTLPKGTKAPGNGRRLFVDLLNVSDKLIARQSTEIWCNTFDKNGYCTAWCSGKTNNGLVKSSGECRIRFFREAETGKVFVLVRGEAVDDQSTGKSTKAEAEPTIPSEGEVARPTIPSEGEVARPTIPQQHTTQPTQPTDDEGAKPTIGTGGNTGWDI